MPKTGKKSRSKEAVKARTKRRRLLKKERFKNANLTEEGDATVDKKKKINDVVIDSPSRCDSDGASSTGAFIIVLF